MVNVEKLDDTVRTREVQADGENLATRLLKLQPRIRAVHDDIDCIWDDYLFDESHNSQVVLKLMTYAWNNLREAIECLDEASALSDQAEGIRKVETT